MPCWTSRSIYLCRQIDQLQQIAFIILYELWLGHSPGTISFETNASFQEVSSPHRIKSQTKWPCISHRYKNKTMFECIAVKEIIFCQLPCDPLLPLTSLHKASYRNVILKFNFKTRKSCQFIWKKHPVVKSKKHSSNQCYQVFLIHKMHALILLTIYPLELQGARMVRGWNLACSTRSKHTAKGNLARPVN